MVLPVIRKLPLLIALVPLLSHALEPEKLFAKASPSAWGVVTSGADRKPVNAGSAVVVGPGKLVTNCHVLRNAKVIQVTKDNVTFDAVLGAVDSERNLCQLIVANFKAPVPEIAKIERIKTGQKVFAITNPDGRESTLSEGFIASVRQQDESGLTAIQTTAPVSAGSSGGGLFDTDGRLVGIITLGVKSSQNFNVARPAAWALEVEQRGKPGSTVADIKNSAPLSVVAAATAINSSDALRVGETLIYQLTERLTRKKSNVAYRVDHIDVAADRIVFNDGARVEDGKGNVITLKARQGGLFESTMPPEGWASLPLTPGKTWNARYTVPEIGQFKLVARVLGDERVVTPLGDFTATKIEWKGWITGERFNGQLTGSSSYNVVAWYSPQLNRIIKFTGSKLGGSPYYTVNEIFELARRSVEPKY
jgi:hypothetical protein